MKLESSGTAILGGEKTKRGRKDEIEGAWAKKIVYMHLYRQRRGRGEEAGERRRVGCGDDKRMEGEREERQLAHGRAGIVLGPVPQEVREGRPHALDEPVKAQIWWMCCIIAGVTSAFVPADVVARGLDKEEDGGAGDHHGDVQQPDV
jgi:hypothetical protein